MNEKVADSELLLITYFHLRKFIGLLAISLPFILLFGNMFIFDQSEIQPSISDYYYTDMRDIFVGILFAFGIFLFSYKGHEREDDAAGNLACVFALGVALFPTSQNLASTNASGYIHAISAALFFLTLSYFSLRLFTKTDANHPTRTKKLSRNKVYKACGTIMLLSMGMIVVYFIVPESIQQILTPYKPVFFLETIMIFSFGISWFTKGQGLLSDT